MEPAQHDDESENGCPNNRLFDRFRKFGCERRQVLLVLRSQVRSPSRIQCEKKNRDWHDCEIDYETGYCDRNGAESPEQVTEDGGTHERHCWRGCRQRVQRADARWDAEDDTGEEKHQTV